MMYLKLVHFCLSNSTFPSVWAANLLGCHLQCLQSCLQGIQEITLPGQPTLQGAGPRWRSRSASIRWLPATSRSPPTSSMPLKSGNKQSSSPESRKVRAASGHWNSLRGLQHSQVLILLMDVGFCKIRKEVTLGVAGIPQAGCCGCQGGVGVVT